MTQTTYELSLHKAEKKKKEEVSEIMKQLVSATNTMGMDKAVASGIVEGLMNSHRTLQQSFVRALLLAFQEIAEKDPSVDLRNEQALKVIKEIAKIDSNLPFV